MSPGTPWSGPAVVRGSGRSPALPSARALSTEPINGCSVRRVCTPAARSQGVAGRVWRPTRAWPRDRCAEAQPAAQVARSGREGNRLGPRQHPSSRTTQTGSTCAESSSRSRAPRMTSHWPRRYGASASSRRELIRLAPLSRPSQPRADHVLDPAATTSRDPNGPGSLCPGYAWEASSHAALAHSWARCPLSLRALGRGVADLAHSWTTRKTPRAS